MIPKLRNFLCFLMDFSMSVLYLHREVRSSSMTSQPQSKIFPEKKSNPIFLARKALRFSQEEFAEILGLTKNYVWMLEAGRKPITREIQDKADQLVELHNSNLTDNPVDRLLRKAQIDSALHETPNQYAGRSPAARKLVENATPGIMRMADAFERMVVGRLSAIESELKTLRADLNLKKKPKR